MEMGRRTGVWDAPGLGDNLAEGQPLHRSLGSTARKRGEPVVLDDGCGEVDRQQVRHGR